MLNKAPKAAMPPASSRHAEALPIFDRIASQIGSGWGAPAPAARHAGALMP